MKPIEGANKIFPVVMKYAGLAGVIYETAWAETDRPYLLALFGAMMGLGQWLQILKPDNNDGDKK